MVRIEEIISKYLYESSPESYDWYLSDIYKMVKTVKPESRNILYMTLDVMARNANTKTRKDVMNNIKNLNVKKLRLLHNKLKRLKYEKG
jgi:hypothetical protein